MHFGRNKRNKRIFSDIYEKNEYRISPEQFRNSLVFDVGAHIGSFSKLALDNRARLVFAFEPQAYNYRLLEENLSDYGNRAVLFNAIAVAKEVDSKYYIEQINYIDEEQYSDINTGGFSVISPGTQDLHEVSVIDLNRLAVECSEIDIMKLDCEGSEFNILEGLYEQNNLKRFKYITGELHFKSFGFSEVPDFFRRFESTHEVYYDDAYGRLGTFKLHKKG